MLGFKLPGGENLNFAVPINYVRGMMNMLQAPRPLKRLGEGLPDTPQIKTEAELSREWRARHAEATIPSSQEPNFPINLRIKHRHAMGGYRHAFLILNREAVEFQELSDQSHNFRIGVESLVQFNSSYASAKGNPAYTIQFSQRTKAGVQLSFEIDHRDLPVLRAYLRGYCSNVLIQ